MKIVRKLYRGGCRSVGAGIFAILEPYMGFTLHAFSHALWVLLIYPCGPRAGIFAISSLYMAFALYAFSPFSLAFCSWEARCSKFAMYPIWVFAYISISLVLSIWLFPMFSFSLRLCLLLASLPCI